jgi:hypothetical protein
MDDFVLMVVCCSSTRPFLNLFWCLDQIATTGTIHERFVDVPSFAVGY